MTEGQDKESGGEWQGDAPDYVVTAPDGHPYDVVARAEVLKAKRRYCKRNGHDFDVEIVENQPRAVVCTRCYRRWRM